MTLGSGEKKTLSYSLTLPDISGNYQLGTELRYSNQGDYRLYGNYSLTVTVRNNASELLTGILADLEGATLTAGKKDRHYIEEAIEELSEIKATASGRKEAEKNIRRITEAAEELGKVSIDVSAIRLKLSELLKIWQTKWSLLAADSPITKGAEGVVKYAWMEKYRLAYETDSRKTEQRDTAYFGILLFLEQYRVVMLSFR